MKCWKNDDKQPYWNRITSLPIKIWSEQSWILILKPDYPILVAFPSSHRNTLRYFEDTHTEEEREREWEGEKNIFPLNNIHYILFLWIKIVNGRHLMPFNIHAYILMPTWHSFKLPHPYGARDSNRLNTEFICLFCAIFICNANFPLAHPKAEEDLCRATDRLNGNPLPLTTTYQSSYEKFSHFNFVTPCHLRLKLKKGKE